MRRLVLALATAMAAPAALIALPAATASAAAPVIVTCKAFTGSETGSNATKCNETSITGGSGHYTASSNEKTFTLKFKTGETATGTQVSKTVTPSTCPAAFATEVGVTNKVTGGTATTLKGGTGKYTICFSSTTLTFELLPGTTFKI